MPIRPENRNRYPVDWKQISLHIRRDRAGWHCECTGHCGLHYGRCGAAHGETNPRTGSVVVLTTMHLNHDPSDCAEENLLAGCQSCHLAYDREHHAQTRRRTQERLNRDAGQLVMFAMMDLQELE